MSWLSKWFKRKKRMSDLTEEDFIKLGAKLVGVFSSGIEPEVPSVTCLQTLAKNWSPDVPERTIDLEIFLFHKFLLVQSLPFQDASPTISQPVLVGFYTALEAMIKDTECPLYVSQFMRSRIHTKPETLAKLEAVWIKRARYYEEPFELDHQEWLEKGEGSGHIPFKRTIIKFMAILRRPTEETVEEMRVIDGFTHAALTVTLVFAAYSKQTIDVTINTLN